MSHMTRLRLILALAALLVGSAATGQELRALFIGNSYTFYSNPNLPTSFELLVSALAGGTTTAEMHAKPGYTLGGHAADAKLEGGPHTLLTENLWDVVILQDQSQIPGFPSGQPQMLESIDGAKYLADLATDSDALVAFLVTWGRRDGDTNNPQLYPDFETMNQRLNSGYNAYATAVESPVRPVALIPAGGVFQSVKDISPDVFQRLYTGDGSHPSQLGTYAAACIAATSLTGRLPSETTWAPGNITEEDGALIRQVVSDLVSESVWTYRDTAYGARPYFTFVSRAGETAPVDGIWEITGDIVRPWVLIDSTLSPLDTVAVQDAVLRLTDGGFLDVTEFTNDTGFFLFDGGTLRVVEHIGSLYQSGGALELSGQTTVMGDHSNLGGALTVTLSGNNLSGSLRIMGGLEFDATIRVTAVGAPSEVDWGRNLITIETPSNSTVYSVELDAPEGFDEDDPEGGDVNGGGHPGAHGDDEEEGEDEGEWVFGEECEPGAGACENDATCEETCESSYCDEDGNCTMDCRIVFRCAERVE